MKRVVTLTEAHHMFMRFFPNADTIDLMDETYDLLAEGQTEKLAKEYDRDMAKIDLEQWQANKRDCDKAARLLVAHVIIRNALSPAAVNAKSLGTVSYLIDGDRNRAHMINVAIEQRGDGAQLVTVEPEGGRGYVTLSTKERLSAWRVSM